MTRAIRIFMATFAALALGACAAAPGPPAVDSPPRATCPDGPWRAAGLDDAAQGLPRPYGEARLRACGLPDRGPSAEATMDTYLSGHAEGQAIYCSPQNAYALGRARRNPTLTCPPPMADQFAAAYAAGLADAIPAVAGSYPGWPVLRPSIGIGVGGGGRVSGGIGIGIGF
jgi:hypothetical protein